MGAANQKPYTEKQRGFFNELTQLCEKYDDFFYYQDGDNVINIDVDGLKVFIGWPTPRAETAE